jgi:molybdopterin/thiamine biosynthesis adenylyltransferase
MNIFSYSELVSRNYIYVDTTLQNRIKNTKLTFIGCGLASVMVEMATRLGFENYTLVDHDMVVLSNLNRQAFRLSNINKPKVEALRENILEINPNVHIKMIKNEIANNDDIEVILKQSDIVINTIDCGELYFNLVHRAMQLNKLVICPFNPGFGGLVVCFNQKSGSVYDLLKSNNIENGLDFSKKLIMNNPEIKLPVHFRDNLNIMFEKITDKGFEPQICIGTNLSSAIAISCIIKYLNNEDIPYCPSILYRSLYDI